MKQLLSLIVSLLILSAPISSAAGGLQMSAEASRFDCPNDPSVVACYKGIVDHSNNLLDFTENLLTDRTEFNDWTQSGTCAVTADQWRNPVNGTMDADYLDNTGGASADYRYIATTPGGSLAGRTFTASVWIRADYNHTCTIRIFENGIGWLVREDVQVDNTWHRYSVTGTFAGGGTNAMQFAAYPGEGGVSTGTAYFYGAQLVENDEWRTGPGIFINPTDQSTIKPRHDLAPTNAPTAAKAHLQGAGGNKLEAKRYNTNQYHGKAHHANFNLNDSDHTYTIIFLGEPTLAVNDRIFSHYQAATDGMMIYINPSFYIRAAYTSPGDTVYVSCPSVAVNDDLYHVVQFVRNGNTGTCYLDGTAGTPNPNLAGTGLDGARNFRLAASDTGGNTLDGSISYFRLDAEALSTDDLDDDREKLLGIATNWGDSNAWDFERSTTAYKTFSNQYENTYPSHSMDLVAVNTPRVSGQGGGLLIEGENIQLHGLTEAFDSWTQSGTCAVTANNYIAPNGTTTADTLDNTGGGNTDRRYVYSANLGSLAGRTFTGSVWVRASTPHIISYQMYEQGIGIVGALQSYYATNEWQRVSVTGVAAGGGTGAISMQVLPGQWGVATGIAEFWGANLTETTFATSYIPNAGAATTQVTRTADDMTMDPHPAGTTEIVIPETFCATCAASKLTVYGEFKCEWSGAADVGAIRNMLEISGNSGTAAWNRNRIMIQVNSNGRIYGYFRDDATTSHSAYSAIDVTDYSEWFSVRFFVDMADLSRMEMTINGTTPTSYSNNSGTGTFDTTNTLIRLQDYDGTVNTYCSYRNLRIVPAEVRP